MEYKSFKHLNLALIMTYNFDKITNIIVLKSTFSFFFTEYGSGVFSIGNLFPSRVFQPKLEQNLSGLSGIHRQLRLGWL